ncbi:hypothetical protein CEXT_90781 [Caerostris extrusa]|uniref:Uncharacterized protein n=1 Tax=Caerostris extrusa TaxID=172846 RepID=A0AAV4P618_CAEEX|nr:hypothetical protein CEXT_90781 [Caerostris extrusa]
MESLHTIDTKTFDSQSLITSHHITVLFDPTTLSRGLKFARYSTLNRWVLKFRKRLSIFFTLWNNLNRSREQIVPLAGKQKDSEMDGETKSTRTALMKAGLLEENAFEENGRQ